MKRVVVTQIFVFCFLFFVCKIGSAQSRQGDPVRFSLGTSAEFTDNRDSVVDGESNVDLYLKPKLDATADWGRGSLVFYYAPSFRYRSDPSATQNDTELQQDVGVRLKHSPVRRFTINVQDRFALTDDPAIQEGGATLRRDSSYIINRAGVGGKIDVAKHTRLDLQLKSMLKRYDESYVALESDEDSANASLVAQQQLSPTFMMFVDVDAGIFEYEHTDDIDRNFDSLSIGVGAYKTFNKTCEGSLRFGQKTFSYDDASLTDDQEPYGSLDLMITPVDTFRVKLGVSHMLKKSDAFPHASQKYTGFDAGLEMDVTKILTFGVSAEYRLGEYDIETVPQEAIDRIKLNPVSYPVWVQSFVYDGETSGEEETMIGTLDVTYKMQNNASIKLSGNYEDVASDVGITFDRTTVSMAYNKKF